MCLLCLKCQQNLAQTLNAMHGWNLSAEEAFLLVFGGPINFIKMGGVARGYWGETFLRDNGNHEIEVYPDMALDGDERWAVHEFGHVFVNALIGRANPVRTLTNIQSSIRGFPDRPLTPNDPNGTWGFAGPRWGWQRSDQGRPSEEFADMFLGWVYNQWEMDGSRLSPAGRYRANFMNQRMPTWVDMAISH